MRALWLVVALFACSKESSDPKPAPKPTTPAATPSPPPPPPPPATVGKCENLELELASKILADAAHPCRARLDAVYGRMIATGVAFSGTVVSTTPERGAGMFLTCQHCTGSSKEVLHDPEIDAPVVMQARAPAQLVGTKVTSGRESQLFFIHRLFSPSAPKSAFDAKGNLVNILPKHDLVIGTVSGKPIEVVGHLGAMPGSTVADDALALHDPREITRSPQWWADAKPGAQALVLGFPRDIADKTFDGELVASVGEILDDERAKSMLLRSDADEAAIAYDPSAEMVIAARASSGMSGGGAFDEEGRYLGISVRGTLKPVDGKYLVRVVRAPYVMKQLQAALDAAPEALRAKVKRFVTSDRTAVTK